MKKELIKNRRSQSQTILASALLIIATLLLNMDTQSLIQVPQPWLSSGIGMLGLLILIRNWIVNR